MSKILILDNMLWAVKGTVKNVYFTTATLPENRKMTVIEGVLFI